MANTEKYTGIFPAFYACYDAEGKVNLTAVRELTQYYIGKGVQGLYVGGTYGVMPELYLELYRCVKAGELEKARQIQNDCCRIIYKMCSGHGNMYAVIKEILRRRGAPDCGSVRAPLAELIEADLPIVEECTAMIQSAVQAYC